MTIINLPGAHDSAAKAATVQNAHATDALFCCVKEDIALNGRKISYLTAIEDIAHRVLKLYTLKSQDMLITKRP